MKRLVTARHDPSRRERFDLWRVACPCHRWRILTNLALETRMLWRQSHTHGTAQNRRENVRAVSHILGAPSSSPYRSGVIWDRVLRSTRMRCCRPAAELNRRLALPARRATRFGDADRRLFRLIDNQPVRIRRILISKNWGRITGNRLVPGQNEFRIKPI